MKLCCFVCKICIINCKKDPQNPEIAATTFVHISLPQSAIFYTQMYLKYLLDSAILYVCCGLTTLALEQSETGSHHPLQDTTLMDLVVKSVVMLK